MNDLNLCLEVVSRSCQPLRYIRRWISQKPSEIEAWFQRIANRKWHMGYQMVTWPMTPRDPCCEAVVRSAILATAWLLVLTAGHPQHNTEHHDINTIKRSHSAVRLTLDTVEYQLLAKDSTATIITNKTTTKTWIWRNLVFKIHTRQKQGHEKCTQKYKWMYKLHNNDISSSSSSSNNTSSTSIMVIHSNKNNINFYSNHS